ncbi:MAG: dihydroorotate dehydrogenase electron transfer subunit [Pseudomonadota bacterium]
MRQFMTGGSITSNTEVQDGHYLMSLLLPLSFAPPLPGQFVMIRLKGRKDMLLARPFSVSGFHRQAQDVRIEILYRIAGQGTRLFAKLGIGEDVDISGPLGRPFDIPSNIHNVILVSGGVGIAPLRYLLACLQAQGPDRSLRIDFYMGAKTIGELLEMETIRCLCDNLQICTDDCSMGHPGLVTEPLEKAIKSYPLDDTLICACGPLGMIRRLSEILLQYPLACQVSLEERMACGLGACLGCAVAVRGSNGERQYQQVCREGPVFNLWNLIWD